MTLLIIITVIVILGSFAAIFSDSFSGTDFTWTDLFRIIIKTILYIPMLIIGIILYISSDFKNHKAGYIVLFLVFSFLAFGLYMGFKAGPSSPSPWN